MEEFKYKWEFLSKKIQICVTEDHKFGTDAFLLSGFAAPKRKDLVCDLGTGCGIVPLLWFREEGPKKIWAVDIQEKAVCQLEKSVAKNDLSGRLIPVLADLKHLEGALPKGELDVVTCNPPYKALGAGILSREKSEQIARHELLCTIRDVCRTSSSLLRFGGRLCLCQRPERLLDTLEAMRQEGVEPKRVRFVQQRTQTAPWLFLVEGRKGSSQGLVIEAPLIIEGGGRDGFSEELLRIYGGGKV